MNSSSVICPACKGSALGTAGHFKFRDFDDSIFNSAEGIFGSCNECGFVRNQLPFSDNDLLGYYSKQSVQSSLVGVGAGGSTAEDLSRYAHYLYVLDGVEESARSIADVGCSCGGLLKYLNSNMGHQAALTGIDADASALSALAGCGINAIQASALDLGMVTDNSFDLAFCTHILEHVINIDRAIDEIKRVMVDDGYVLIEVPDAARYAEARVHDFFWIGLREHVNHFTPLSLCTVLSRHNIEVKAIHRSNLMIKSGIHYPSLIVIARIKKSGEASPSFRLKRRDSPSWFSKHLQMERHFSEKTRHNLATFLRGAQAGSIWGMGTDFFSLLALGILEVGGTTVLLDSNKAKQNHTVSNCPILAPTKERIAGPMICASSLSWKSIVEQASAWGLDETQIFCL